MGNAERALGVVDLLFAFPWGSEDCEFLSSIDIAWAALDARSYPVEYVASVFIVVVSASGLTIKCTLL